MRNVFFAATALATMAISAPAFAQDQDTSFSGPRAEGVVGWDRIQDGETDGTGSSGVVYGGAVGYDIDLGSAVIGFEGEATGATTDETTGGVLAAGDSLKVSAGRDLYVGGRVGFKAGSNALIYAKGGYTNARINETYTAGTTTVDTHDDLDGWRLGAGAEFKLGGKLYAKAEYRYSHYNELDGYSIDLDRHQVVGGIGIRF